VAKVLQALSRGGYLRTIKGKGGGVELAVSAQKIFLQDVIQLMEGPIYLMECTVNKDACFMSSRCRLRLKLKEAQNNMIDVFKSTSLADLLPGGKD
jgi:Rrf2 family nitric oxide-sensitive transcriptional repressor